MRNLIGGFVDKLQTIVFDSSFTPTLQMPARLLCLRPKDGIATANVRHDGMGAALRVAQRHPTLLTRIAAVCVAGPCREEPAEDTVLGMKNRQVLISDAFKSTGS